MKRKSRCVNCVIRFLEADCTSLDRLKQISSIFGLDPSNLDRQFISAKGVSVKQYLDEKKKTKLLLLLDNNYCHGYEVAPLLGFKSDHSFYHWVKRSFGVSFKELRNRQMSSPHQALR
jgi:AraC-like DNA-binding protein